MKKINVKSLSDASFSKFGTYVNLFSPEGENTQNEGFFRDIFHLDPLLSTTACFSTVRVAKRPFIIDLMESHKTSGEIIIPLDGDVIVQVAPATDFENFPADFVEAFIVPKGTAVSLNQRVWHFAPFAYNCDKANVMVIQDIHCDKDFFFHHILEDDKIEILLP